MTASFIGFVAGFLTSIAAIPQLIHTIKTKQTRDLSLWQPLLLSVGVFLWLVYGFLISDMPIIIANIVPLLCNMLLTIIKIKSKD